MTLKTGVMMLKIQLGINLITFHNITLFTASNKCSLGEHKRLISAMSPLIQNAVHKMEKWQKIKLWIPVLAENIVLLLCVHACIIMFLILTMLFCLCWSSISVTWLTEGKPTTTDWGRKRGTERRRPGGFRTACTFHLKPRRNRNRVSAQGQSQRESRAGERGEERGKHCCFTCCCTLPCVMGMGPGGLLRKFWLGGTCPGCIWTALFIWETDKRWINDRIKEQSTKMAQLKQAHFKLIFWLLHLSIPKCCSFHEGIFVCEYVFIIVHVMLEFTWHEHFQACDCIIDFVCVHTFEFFFFFVQWFILGSIQVKLNQQHLWQNVENNYFKSPL